jgi:hypothetical protein
LIPVESGLLRHGYKVGVDSGRREPDPDTEATLRDFAGDSAQRLAAAPFCPKENSSDAEAQRDYESVLSDLDQAKDQVENARTRTCECERELAAQQPEPTQPKPPFLVGLLGVLGIATTLAFSLNDLMFANGKLFPDHQQGLFVAWIVGAILAGLITWSMLSGASQEGSGKRHWWGVGVGVAFGFGLLLLRMSTVRGDGERLVAWGFAVLEVVAVVVVDLYANGLRRGWETYRRRRPGYCEATFNLESARKHVQDREAAVQALEARAERFREAIRFRESLVRSTTLVRAAAERAIITGYRQGIEQNRGRRRGAEQLPDDDGDILSRLGRSGGGTFRRSDSDGEPDA